MWISEIAERSIIDATSSMTVTYRASRVDDEPTSDTERKQYPCMVISASSGSKDSTEDLFTTINVAVSIITHYEDDPKATALAGLEESFMKIIDAKINASTLKTSFDSIASAAGETRYFKGLTDIEGSQIEKTEKQQMITINMVMHVCGS